MQVYIASCTICALLTSSKIPSGHWTDDGSAVSTVLMVYTNEGNEGMLQGDCAACEKSMLKVGLLV